MNITSILRAKAELVVSSFAHWMTRSGMVLGMMLAICAVQAQELSVCGNEEACNYGSPCLTGVFPCCVVPGDLDVPVSDCSNTGFVYKQFSFAAEGSLFSATLMRDPCLDLPVCLNPDGSLPDWLTYDLSETTVTITEVSDLNTGPSYSFPANASFFPSAPIEGEVWQVTISSTQPLVGGFVLQIGPVCEGQVISGCMDDEACNYDAFATAEDGSCVYCDGCGTCNPETGECSNAHPEDRCDCTGTPGMFEPFSGETTGIDLPTEWVLSSAMWQNVENGAGDAVDWIPSRGPTKTGNTGPHPGVGYGPYVHLDASDCDPSQKGILMSEELTLPVQMEYVDLSWRYSRQGTWTEAPLVVEVQEVLPGGSDWISLATLDVEEIEANENEDVEILEAPESYPSDVWEELSIRIPASIGSDVAIPLIEERTLRFRFVGHTGDGDAGDVTLDDIRVCIKGCGFDILDHGTAYRCDIKRDCPVRIQYTRPDNAQCSNKKVAQAELLMSFNLGTPFIFGQADVHMEELKLDADVLVFHEGVESADGAESSGKSWVLRTDTTDSGAILPELVHVFDFEAKVEDLGATGRFELANWDFGWEDAWSDLEGAEGLNQEGFASLPGFLGQVQDSLQLDVEVRYREHVAPGSNPPNELSRSGPTDGSTVQPLTFSWTPTCQSMPLFRFQMLRLYDSDGSEGLPVTTSMNEQEWDARALTLETSVPSISLIPMEGSGFYAWRVCEIGDFYPGGAANSNNWGEYTSLGVELDAATHTLDISSTSTYIFEFTDPADKDGAEKNITYTRSYSRNGEEGAGDSLLILESVTYHTEDLFAQQSQVRMNSNGVTLLSQNVRDYSGQTPLALMGVPVSSTDDMDYREKVVAHDGTLYRAEHFDGDQYGDPLPVTDGALVEYYSDDNPDKQVPGAEGYPFTAMTYREDATSRPKEIGGAGPILRLGAEDTRTVRMAYSMPSRFEMMRVLGAETPEPQSVEKVITISPENVTSVSYVDRMGRLLMTCLDDNGNRSEDILSVDKAEFDNPKVLKFRQHPANEFLYIARTTEFFTEPGSDYSLYYDVEGKVFDPECVEYCGRCDYRVVLSIHDTDADPTAADFAPLMSDTLVVAGEELSNCVPQAVTNFDWSSTQKLKGSLTVSVSVELNAPDEEGVRALDAHVDEVVAQARDEIGSVLAPLREDLMALSENGAASGIDLDDIHDWCASEGEPVLDAEGDTLGFSVSVPTLSCDSLLIPYRPCPDYCHILTYAETWFSERVKARIIADTTRRGIEVPAVDGSVDTAGKTVLIDLAVRLDNWFTTDDFLTTTFSSQVANQYEFNQIIANMLADGEADPETFPGYTCENIYRILSDIAASYHLQHQPRRLDVVDRLVADLNPHYRGQTDEAGDFDGGSEGYNTHPHKWVKEGSTESSCYAERSVFQSTLNFYALDESEDYDAATLEVRRQIENAYAALHNCLYGLKRGDLRDWLGGKSVNALSTVPCRTDDVMRSVCDKQVEARKAQRERKVDALLASMTFTSDEEKETTRTCFLQSLKDHAYATCTKIPYIDCFQESTPVDSLEKDSAYVVDVNSIPGYHVRYGQEVREYAEFSQWGKYFIAESSEPVFGALESTALDATTCGVINPDIYKVTSGPGPSSLDDPDLMDDVARVSRGVLELCVSGCDTSYEALSAPHRIPGDTVICTQDFEWHDASDGEALLELHSSAPSCPSSWEKHGVEVDKDLSGTCQLPEEFDYLPMLVRDNRLNAEGNTALRIGSGKHPEADLMEGYMAAIEGVSLDVDSSYRLTMDAWPAGEEQIDNLYILLVSASTFSDGGGGWNGRAPSVGSKAFCDCDQEQLIYPSTAENGVFVVEHIKNMKTGKSIEADFNAPNFNATTSTTDVYKLIIYALQEHTSDPAFVYVDDLNLVELDPASSCSETLHVRYTFPDLEDPVIPVEQRECGQDEAYYLLADLEGQEQRLLRAIDEDVREAYRTQCVPEHNLTTSSQLNYGHYTLYGYDPAGNLLHTVPPKGVTVTDDPDSLFNPFVEGAVGAHTMVTRYQYNGVGNVVYRETPDGGVVRTWYDRLERVRFTQTTQDVEDGQFRYVCYDEISRPIRSGVASFGGFPPAMGVADASDLQAKANDVNWPVDDAASPCTACKERISTYHDIRMPETQNGFSQENLYNRISYVVTEEGDTAAFSYDPQGRVTSMFRHVEFDPDVDGEFNHVVHYDFDVVSGNMLMVRMNPGREDQFFMRYAYDEDQRIVSTSSSRDSIIWHRDAATEYYLHGPVRRVTLGHYGVQGVDMTYNLHGQLIGLNLPTDDPGQEPGQDGHVPGEGASNPHQFVAPDAFALQQSYYKGDFNRAGSPFTADDAFANARLEGPDYRDGNLSAVSWRQRALAQSASETGDPTIVGHAFTLDELSRLREAAYRELEEEAWSTSDEYKSTYAFDANGNLTTLQRWGSEGQKFDDFEYHYGEGNNQLDHIDDDVAQADIHDNDLEDQAEGNYAYDADGRLTKDMAADIDNIVWRADDKVVRYEKSGDTLAFRYGPFRHRVMKTSNTKRTLYLRDIDGNIMAVYEMPLDGSEPLHLEEVRLANGNYTPLDTLGLALLEEGEEAEAEGAAGYARHLGERQLEISDLLGNVRAVVSDIEPLVEPLAPDTVVTSQDVDIVSASDYHPYGMLMEDRTFEQEGGYRYGFNGKEKDDELKGEGNAYDLGARHYDPRVGRMLSLDPRSADYAWQSPYAYHANQPHQSIDYMGAGAELGTGIRYLEEYITVSIDVKKPLFLHADGMCWMFNNCHDKTKRKVTGAEAQHATIVKVPIKLRFTALVIDRTREGGDLKIRDQQYEEGALELMEPSIVNFKGGQIDINAEIDENEQKLILTISHVEGAESATKSNVFGQSAEITAGDGKVGGVKVGLSAQQGSSRTRALGGTMGNIVVVIDLKTREVDTSDSRSTWPGPAGRQFLANSRVTDISDPERFDYENNYENVEYRLKVKVDSPRPDRIRNLTEDEVKQRESDRERQRESERKE